jgi:hypothetical protein
VEKNKTYSRPKAGRNILFPMHGQCFIQCNAIHIMERKTNKQKVMLSTDQKGKEKIKKYTEPTLCNMHEATQKGHTMMCQHSPKEEYII